LNFFGGTYPKTKVGVYAKKTTLVTCHPFVELLFLGNQRKKKEDLACIFYFLVLDPHLKAMGPIYGSHPIRLLYFIGPWTMDPNLKWPKVA
jgi:hypothetical protein